jgi:hypothetical protein
MSIPNKYFEKADTKRLLQETIRLLDICWEEGFGKRIIYSVLELLMEECEARGIEFIPGDNAESLIVRYKPPAAVRASDVATIGERWDGK